MQVSSCWAESLQRNVMTQCPGCSQQQNSDHSVAPQLKQMHDTASRGALQHFTFFTPLCTLPLRTQEVLKEISFTLSSSHAKRKKQWSCNLLHFHSSNCRADKGLLEVHSHARELQDTRWCKDRKSVSDLTITLEYLKSLLSGRL